VYIIDGRFTKWVNEFTKVGFGFMSIDWFRPKEKKIFPKLKRAFHAKIGPLYKKRGLKKR